MLSNKKSADLTHKSF